MKTRRQLLRELAALAPAAVGFPTIVKASALGLNGAVAASDRVTFATIGVGWMGGDHVDLFLKIPGAQYLPSAIWTTSTSRRPRRKSTRLTATRTVQPIAPLKSC